MKHIAQQFDFDFMLNQFNKLDAQDEMSQLAKVRPDELTQDERQDIKDSEPKTEFLGFIQTENFQPLGL